MRDILLSICVPTYNGGDRIGYCLSALEGAVETYSNIEVIVSDNCSNDNTKEVVDSYCDNARIRVYRNDTNLGLNGNIKLLIDKYAVGKYCWIIGDDDIVDTKAFSALLDMLESENPSFVSVRHQVMTSDQLKLFTSTNDLISYKKTSYFNCLDINASSSNILGTFMSSQIFLLDDIKSFDKSTIGDNSWDDFRVTFPNSYMMTQTFCNSKNCICVTTPVITAIEHEKTWDDKMYRIVMDILPNYFNYCLSLSKNTEKLSNTQKLINNGIIYRNIYELKHGQWKKIKWNYFFSPCFMSLIYNKIFNKSK